MENMWSFKCIHIEGGVKMLKKYLLVMIGVPLLFAMLGRALALAQRDQVESVSHQPLVPQPREAAPVTLAEAWGIVNTYAQQWQPGAKVVALHSIDHAEDALSSGQDGRRRAWRATILSARRPRTELVIALVDGSIQEESRQLVGSDSAPLSRPLALDSPEALRRTLEVRPEFTPESGKGNGFHFALENSPAGSSAITVRGLYGGMPAIVSIDASTGTLLTARSLGFESGGILYSQDAGRTWQASDLIGRMVPAIVPDPLVEGWAYAVTTQDQNIVIYQTQDGGKHWNLFGSLPASAGDWPFDLEAAVGPSREVRLFVGTWSGVWSSTNGKDWVALPGLPEGPKQWLAVAHSLTRDRLFVSVTAGENRGLYASADLSMWNRLAQEGLRLSESFDRRTVLATSDQRGGPALVLRVEDEAQMEMVGAVLRAAGDFNGAGLFVLQSPLQGTGRWSAHGGSWTLSVPVASLAAAPDFSNSQTVIAGGFRTGIYRSINAGQNWEMILADPSEIVAGSNEILDVAFLSPHTVVAVNGGVLTWKDF